jgi:hypothetical protein
MPSGSEKVATSASGTCSRIVATLSASSRWTPVGVERAQVGCARGCGWPPRSRARRAAAGCAARRRRPTEQRRARDDVERAGDVLAVPLGDLEHDPDLRVGRDLAVLGVGELLAGRVVEGQHDGGRPGRDVDLAAGELQRRDRPVVVLVEPLELAPELVGGEVVLAATVGEQPVVHQDRDLAELVRADLGGIDGGSAAASVVVVVVVRLLVVRRAVGVPVGGVVGAAPASSVSSGSSSPGSGSPPQAASASATRRCGREAEERTAGVERTGPRWVGQVEREGADGTVGRPARSRTPSWSNVPAARSRGNLHRCRKLVPHARIRLSTESHAARVRGPPMPFRPLVRRPTTVPTGWAAAWRRVAARACSSPPAGS